MQNNNLPVFDEEQMLSPAESLIMKAIWDATQEEECISIPQLIENLRLYGKDYARTTVVTFLLKLSNKRYVVTTRKGKISYAYPRKTMEEYRKMVLKDVRDMWYEGNADLIMEDLKNLGE